MLSDKFIYGYDYYILYNLISISYFFDKDWVNLVRIKTTIIIYGMFVM